MEIPTPLIGCDVEGITFDYQVRLRFLAPAPVEGYRADAELVIETPFLLCDRHGAWHELDPGTGSALGPALDLFRRTVTALEIVANGGLHLTFNDGCRRTGESAQVSTR